MTAESSPVGLSGQVAIVTGAALGIGYGIAEQLAVAGVRLVLCDIQKDALQQAATKLRDSGAEVSAHVGDLSQQAVVIEMVEAAIARFGTLQILVNNAGGGVILPFLEHTAETLHETVNRNLWTTIWCTRAVLPHMLNQGYGRIVNIGADSVRNGLWDHAAYNAAKGGVHGLTTGLAREFARTGITVNTVAPSEVRTHTFDAFQRNDPALIEKFLSVVPMGRPAEVSEVASAVNYLASPQAGFITGQVISVNGGSTMM